MNMSNDIWYICKCGRREADLGCPEKQQCVCGRVGQWTEHVSENVKRLLRENQQSAKEVKDE